MDWNALEQTCMGCQRCALADGRHNVVFGVGSRDAEVLFVGEGPGENEDLQGEPFVGQLICGSGAESMHLWMQKIITFLKR